MRPSAIRQRPDQISELTRGLELPLPEIQIDHLEIIAEGLLRAFNDIRASAPLTVASGNEAEVTALMEARLSSLIEQDPIWGQLVRFVARGKESLSFDGSHIEERPDLSLNLTRRDARFPLVVEAKILDAASGKTRNLYCEQGLRRFLEGKYAWGTREAFMLAYVRDGSSITATLTPFLSGTVADGTPGYLVEELPTSQGVPPIDLARSRHGRSFVYTHQAPPASAPGPIALWHLWLPASVSASSSPAP
jgi:hypothetical protein